MRRGRRTCLTESRSPRSISTTWAISFTSIEGLKIDRNSRIVICVRATQSFNVTEVTLWRHDCSCVTTYEAGSRIDRACAELLTSSQLSSLVRPTSSRSSSLESLPTSSPRVWRHAAWSLSQFLNLDKKKLQLCPSRRTNMFVSKIW